MSGEDRPTTAPTSDSRTSRDQRAASWQLICGAAVAAVAGWALLQVEAVNEWFEIPEELQKIYQPNAEQAQRIVAATRVAEYKNSAWVVGLLGALIGAVLGLVSAVPTRSAVKAALGLLCGTLSGALLGAVGGALGIALGEQLTGGWPVEGIVPAAVMHSVFWALAGCGIGLGVGLPTRSGAFIGRAALAGFGAGLVGGLLYVPLASVLFPVVNSELPFPNGQWNRLFWVALPTLLVAAAVSRISKTAQVKHKTDL